MQNKIINYAGNKSRYLDFILPKITEAKNLGCKIYAEPFAGSASIYYNIPIDFDIYYLNDLNRSLVSIIESVKITPYTEFKSFYNTIINKYGSLKVKESYYAFRDDFNKYYYNKPEHYKHGLSLILLINACINNLARFSKNGFNQSYGNRDYTLTGLIDAENGEAMWNDCKIRLNTNTHLLNDDYLKIIEKFNLSGKDTLLVLDPPYYEKPSYCYGQEFNSKDFNTFIDFISKIDAKVIYTDVNHDRLPNFKKTEMRIINSSAPSFKGKNTAESIECMYTNF